MLKLLRKSMDRELKDTMIIICEQNENISEEIEIITKKEGILEMKNT